MDAIPEIIPYDPVTRLSSGSVRQLAHGAIALVVLIVLAIPFLVLMLLIRLDSRGPAIFRQIRLGNNSRPFVFYKFRTMYQDSERRFPELYDYANTDSAQDFQFKRRGDPRITRAGRILRRTGLDELPNLINVVKGDCALVGPRPDIPEMLEHYTSEQCVRFSVPQGLICLAQVHGANRLTFNETANLDVEYVRTRSVHLDVRIILRVVQAVVRGDLH
jgi:lipopolysaccharide/colanic/teichoic acid biosynthesis glycosyltransferase